MQERKSTTGLWKINEDKIFLPFKVKEIVDTVIAEYYVGTEKVELIFEGTTDEYEELANICNEDGVKDKIHLTRSTRVLENARDILSHAKEAFNIVQPIIKNIVKDDAAITKLIPLNSVGSIKFGMDRRELCNQFEEEYIEFKKTKFSKNTTDDYGKFHVFYTSDDKVEAVEIFEGIEVILDLLSDIEEDNGSFTHVKMSIGLEAPGSKAESILVGCEDYYS